MWVIGVVILIGLFFLAQQKFFSRAVQPCVIVVSGISASGKSSVVDALHEKLGPTSVVIRLDAYFQKIVAQKARSLGWSEQQSVGAWEFLRMHIDEDVEHEVFDYQIRTTVLDYQLFYDAISQALKKYEYVLVDTIVECDRQHHELASVIDTAQSKWVLLYCPLRVVAERFAARTTMASFVNSGVSLTTYESFMSMYTPLRGVHWTPLDSIDPVQTRLQLDHAIHHVLSVAPRAKKDAYKHHTDAFRKQFLDHFTIADGQHSSIALYPSFRFDLVLNSSKESVKELAREIVQTIAR